MDFLATITKEELTKIVSEYVTAAGMHIKGELKFNLETVYSTPDRPGDNGRRVFKDIQVQVTNAPETCEHDWRPIPFSGDVVAHNHKKCIKCGRLEIPKGVRSSGA